MSRARRMPPAAVALRFVTLIGIFALAACGQSGLRPAAPLRSSADLHTAHVASISTLRAWHLAGRLAVQRGYKGFSADLDWHEAMSAYALRVAAPLNGGTFALDGTADGVTLVTPKGERYTAIDAETLMHKHLGWALPIAGTRYWIRGLPDPAYPVTGERLDEAGRWTEFAQDGWQISVLEYRVAAGLDLPRRLALVHDKLKVRMVIKSWEPR